MAAGLYYMNRHFLFMSIRQKLALQAWVGHYEHAILACTACQVTINLNLTLIHFYLNENNLCPDQMQLKPDLGMQSLQHMARPFHCLYMLICINYHLFVFKYHLKDSAIVNAMKQTRVVAILAYFIQISG